MKRKGLNWISIGLALASIHYGLGFLVGSGESIYKNGSLGILYGLSTALGLLFLSFIAPFYWKHKLPIWDLMGKDHGQFVKKDVAFLSGVWMVGVIASQILGGSWAMTIFGINRYVSMAVISILIFILSSLNLGKLSKIFTYMLFFSSAILLIIMFKIGVSFLSSSVIDLRNSLGQITIYDILGTVVSTILVTFIGMDFHQFIVTSKKVKDSVLGSLFGFAILLVLSITLLSLIQGSMSKGLINGLFDAKQAIPTILYNFGYRIMPIFGIIFSLPIIFVSIGSGSGVTKIVTKNVISLAPLKLSEKIARIVIIITAVLIALIGNSIIDLIVSFYSIYVGSVILPFALYVLIEKTGTKVFGKSAIKTSLIFGTLCSCLSFLFYFIHMSPITEHLSTYILISGVFGSLIGVLSSLITHVFSVQKMKSKEYLIS